MAISLSRDDFEKACDNFLSYWNQPPETIKENLVGRKLIGPSDYTKGWRREAHSMNDRLGYLVCEPFDRFICYQRSQNDGDKFNLVTNSPIRPKQPLSSLSTSPSDDDEELVVNMSIPDEQDETSAELSFRSSIADRSDREKIWIRLRCWVIYSDSYRVPQLLFDAFKSDGVPLTLNEILNSNIFIRQTSYLDLLKDDITLNQRIDHEYPFSTLERTTGVDIGSSNLIIPFLTQVEHPYTHTPAWSIHPCNTPIVLAELLKSAELTKSIDLNSKVIIEAFLTLLSGLMNLRR